MARFSVSKDDYLFLNLGSFSSYLSLVILKFFDWQPIVFGEIMKKSKSIMLLIAPVLSTLLFNACGGNETSSTTRDVYQNREDCVKDWGEQDLCEQMNDDDDREYRRSGVIYAGRPFYGPTYYPSDRAVLYKGRNISPTGSSTTLKPYSVTSRSSSSSRSSSISSPRSSSTSYGGFGGSRSSGGGSSS